MAYLSLSDNPNNVLRDAEEPMELCQRNVMCSKYEDTKQPPAKFSDPSSISPPESLRELVARLHEIFEHDDISVEYVQALMASYKSNRREWKRFAKFDPHRYTRNLVDEGNGKFNLMVLCWNEGQGSSIHSHANSHCFLKVLSGGVKEELFEWPSEKPSGVVNVSSESDGPVMKKWAENGYVQDQCTYINDNIGLHRVENTSHSDKAVTLHLYSPPFDECECFDERTGRAVTAKVTFWSKYGRRTPFGRCPETAENPCQADNN
ncbi:hypothetical protein BsWGS_29136 [Bradybaena similaris]